MDSTFLQLDACWVPTETSWRQLRGLIRWSLVIWTTWSTFLIDDLIYLIRWSLVLSLRSTSPACLFNRNLDCLAFIAVLDHFLCRRRGSELNTPWTLKWNFLTRLSSLKSLVGTWWPPSEVRAWHALDRMLIGGFSLAVCANMHPCIRRSVQMRLIFNSLTGKEQEPPS